MLKISCLTYIPNGKINYLLSNCNNSHLKVVNLENIKKNSVSKLFILYACLTETQNLTKLLVST